MPSSFTCLALAATLLSAQAALAQGAADLFFSEYVEGSGNNKALEIYNGTDQPVDLGASGYRVEMYFNGSGRAQLSIDLQGVVPAGGTFVLVHASADAIPLGGLERYQTGGAGWFNGNDAIVLRRGATFVDAFGQIGHDPGSSWGEGATGTKNRSLRRSPTVLKGDDDPTDPFDPALEWLGADEDDFGGLGAHSIG